MANKFPKNGLSLSETIEQIEKITGYEVTVSSVIKKSFVQSIGRDGTVKADHYYHGTDFTVRLFTVNDVVGYYSITSPDGKYDYSSI